MKKVKWGILGCGNIAHKFAEALTVVEDAELLAVGSRDLTKAQRFATQWDAKLAYGSYLELATDPKIDIIYIATPHSYHFGHAKLCLEAGKNVLCEKPFTINAAQLKILINLAQEKELFMMEAFWTRFLPGIIKAKELIDQGKLGKIYSLEADFGINFPYHPEHRIYNPLLGGGALLDIGIYPLFLSYFLFGFPESIKAAALLDENNIDFTTSIIAKSADGTMSHLNSTIKANTNTEDRIYGEKGSIQFEEKWFTPVGFCHTKDDGDKTEYKFKSIKNGYEYEAIEAMKCLRTGMKESALLPLKDSLQLMILLDEIRKQCKITYPPEIESLTPYVG